MKTGMKVLSVLIVSLVVLLANLNVCYGKDIRLTDKDKAQIIKSILMEIDFLNRGLRVGERKEVVYLGSVARIILERSKAVSGPCLCGHAEEDLDKLRLSCCITSN